MSTQNPISSILVPGYTVQGFSCLRSKIYETAEKIQPKHPVPKFMVGFTAVILSKTTEYVEIPFRLVEDIALGLINLVGAIFSKGCRQNLNGYMGKCFAMDVMDILLLTYVAFVPPTLLLVAAYHFLEAALQHDVKKLKDGQENVYDQIKALRKFDYKSLQIFEIAVNIQHSLDKLTDLEDAMEDAKSTKTKKDYVKAKNLLEESPRKFVTVNWNQILKLRKEQFDNAIKKAKKFIKMENDARRKLEKKILKNQYNTWVTLLDKNRIPESLFAEAPGQRNGLGFLQSNPLKFFFKPSDMDVKVFKPTSVYTFDSLGEALYNNFRDLRTRLAKKIFEAKAEKAAAKT